MRDTAQVQRAHDVLLALVLSDVPTPVSEADLELLHAALDTLCWVLQHDHNNAFAGNLAQVEKFVEALGYRLDDKEGD